MSNQLFSNSTTLFPFNQSLFPDSDVVHSLGAPAKRWDNVHCDACIASTITTTSHITDSVVMDITNQDVKMARDSVNHMLIDDNAGGDATLQVSKYEVGDPNFNFQFDPIEGPTLQFDVGDVISYDRVTNEMKFKIGSAPNPDIIITDGLIQIDNKIAIGNATTFITKITSGPTNGDVIWQNNATNYLYFDSSADTLTIRAGGADNVDIAPTFMSSLTHLPRSSNTYDLGSTSNYWRDSFFDGVVYTDNISPKTANGRVNVANANFGYYNNNLSLGLNLNSVPTGTYNIGVGTDAGFRITSGNNNHLMGRQCGDFITTANHTVAIGYQACRQISSQSDNTCVGNFSGPAAAYIETVSFGFSAKAGADYYCQLGQSGTGTTTGKMKYREQILCDESWKALTVDKASIIDSSGNITYDTSESVNDYTDNISSSDAVDTSAGTYTIKVRRYRDVVTITWPLMNLTLTNSAAIVFDTIIASQYRPVGTAYTFASVSLNDNTNGYITGVFRIDQASGLTPGQLVWLQDPVTNFNLGATIIPAGSFSYVI